ncbi:hypothetical protein [Streptomyces bohaiensis]|uniref:hypothetical protein n=1 Tax=Streptomyces bohaiensis TaxID=1431344 RepID=UPI003B7C9B2C
MTTRPRDGGTGGPEPLDTERAEAAIVEHYRRLVRLAYVVLPPSLGRHRRVLTAHAVAQRALPREKSVAEEAAAVPRQRAASGPAADPGYALVRLRTLRGALDTGRPPRLAGRELGRLRRAQPVLPRVLGLRLRPTSGAGEALELEKALAGVSSSTRAAFALQRLEGMSREEARALLVAAGMSEPHAHGAVTSAARLPGAEEAEQAGAAAVPPPLEDPAVLHLHPTDLVRRRRRLRTAVAVAAAAVVGAGLLAVVPDRGPTGNPAALQALDPSLVVKARADSWESATRLDFTGWPARGALTDDNNLLRRALAVWADPDDSVRVSATPGTAAGPAAGPPQLLYAGEVGDARLVILHDGLRLVRYGEPLQGEGAVLDFARTDGADGSTSAVVLNRDADTTRYLTAPWVSTAAAHDLLTPGAEPRELAVDEEGVTGPVVNVFNRESCTTYPVVRFAGGEGADAADGAPGASVLADMGELLPARIGDAGDSPLEGPGSEVWARTACHLSSVNGEGVRSVTSTAFAAQELPGGAGTAQWVCTRAETWRGAGSRAMTQFQAPQPEGEPLAPGVVTARAEDTAACGERAPDVVGGILWRSDGDQWYLLAAGSEGITSLSAEGGVTGSVPGRVAALPATEGAEAELRGTRADGTAVEALG